MELGPHVVAAREAALRSALLARGLRATHQRLQIVAALARADDHPNAEDVFERVSRRIPTLSRDTVYRTLDVLAAHGPVRRIAMPRATRFDPELNPHHHFICDHCGRLVDIGAEMVKSPKVPEVLAGIGDVRSVSLEIHGICHSCRS